MLHAYQLLATSAVGYAGCCAAIRAIPVSFIRSTSAGQLPSKPALDAGAGFGAAVIGLGAATDFTSGFASDLVPGDEEPNESIRNSVIVKPARIAMRMSGMNALE